MSNDNYTATPISQDLHDMIFELEEAVMDYVDPSSDRDKTDRYTVLCYQRKFLYEYLSEIEREAGVLSSAPTTLVRFI